MNYSYLLSAALFWPVGLRPRCILEIMGLGLANDGLLRISCLLIPIAAAAYHRGRIGTMKRIGLLATLTSVLFLFTGTTCLAGSTAFHRSQGLSLQQWKRGYLHFVGSQDHTHQSFYKYRHLGRPNQKLSSFGLLGGYYAYSDRDDNIRINLVLSPYKQKENIESKKDTEDRLPPHIEILLEEDKQAVSSYKTFDYKNTEAHIVEYQAD